MRAAASLLALTFALTLALAACNNESPKQGETSNVAVTEVEALPPDESVETPADELANGAAEPTDGAADTGTANTGNTAY